MRRVLPLLTALLLSGAAFAEPAPVRQFPLVGTSVPQQIQAAPGGAGVWFAAANLGAIGRLDPASGDTAYFALGNGAKPRGLVLGPAGHIFALDQALNVIHELDPRTGALRRHLMPGDAPHLDLAEAALAPDGMIWFTGYAGWFGALDPATGAIRLWPASNGRGLYSVAVGADGKVWLASVTANAIGAVDAATGAVDWSSPPKGVGGLKGLAVDRKGDVWLAANKTGQIARFDSRRRAWFVFRLPGEAPRPHALAVMRDGRVLVTDTAGNRLLAFDPGRRDFTEVASLTERGMAKHMAEFEGSVWIAEAASDQVIHVRMPDVPSL